MVLGDIQAQVSSNHVGARRLRRVHGRVRARLARGARPRGADSVRAGHAGGHRGDSGRGLPRARSGSRRRRAPAAALRRARSRATSSTVDFEGAPPQRRGAAVNCTLTYYTAAHTVYAVKSILTPETPSNADCFGPLHVRRTRGQHSELPVSGRREPAHDGGVVLRARGVSGARRRCCRAGSRRSPGCPIGVRRVRAGPRRAGLQQPLHVRAAARARATTATAAPPGCTRPRRATRPSRCSSSAHRS